jgi:hypothetical protein
MISRMIDMFLLYMILMNSVEAGKNKDLSELIWWIVLCFLLTVWPFPVFKKYPLEDVDDE